MHPEGCRLVGVEVLASGRRAAKEQDARVRSFVSAVPEAQDPSAFSQALGRVRQERKLSRDVWVTVWGLRGIHQLLRLPPAKPDALEAIARREARKDLAALEAGGAQASLAIIPGSEVQIGSQRRREVSLVAVSAAEVEQRVQPLVDAGFVVRGVVTPALALAAMARLQRELSGAVAYVAIVGGATCLAIVRDGVLLFAREMPWGHELERGPEAAAETGDADSRFPTPDSLPQRLASELKRSILFFKQTFRTPVEAVALCGDMPNLRSLTAPLGDALAVPVQTLDSLVGIDAASVPEPADLFRRDVASLRMIIATGADATPPANLLPTTVAETRETRRQIVRLVASAAAGLALTTGWYTVARQTSASQHGERDAIQRELAILEPDASRQAGLQQAYTLTSSRQMALTSFDSQGPRLARLLETIAASAPEEVTLNAVNVQTDRAFWRADIRGIAVSRDAAVAQAAVNAFIAGLSSSPFAGPPERPPSRRIITGRGAPASASASGSSPIPPGMTGVEFAMQLRVAK